MRTRTCRAANAAAVNARRPFQEGSETRSDQRESSFEIALQIADGLKADRNTRYETVAETMSAARRAGLTKIGFVTQPGEGQP